MGRGLRAAIVVTIIGLLSSCGSSSSSGSDPKPGGSAPSIVTQPANQTVSAGQTATFSVTATGTAPLAYQWQKSGTAITGATSATYTTPGTTTGDNGAQFTVVVSNNKGTVTSSPATLTVNAISSGPTITTQPASQTVSVGQTATFTVAAAGAAPLSYQWQKNGASITGATTSSYTTPAASASDDGSQFQVVVSNSAGSVTSNTATLTVTSASTTIDVLTYHNDVARTGQNLNETVLNASNVVSATFGKVGFFPADGLVDAQPLYVSSVGVGGGTRNLLIVASEHDTVYAYDADTGTVIWHKTMLKTGEITSDQRGCSQVVPEIGVTSTPVIDRGSGPNGAIYVVAMSKDGSGNYHQRLHALDLALGTELFGEPIDIQATYPGSGVGGNGTTVAFSPGQYKERAALLLLNGTIYTTWASHCDIPPYTGWVIGYSAATLEQATVLNLTPNGSDGAIWMSGAGPAADNSGNIYILDANGDFDTNLNAQGMPVNGDFGNAFLKLSTGSDLAVADYFEMFNQSSENSTDIDLGSGGALVLPDLSDGAGHTLHLAVGAGKDTNIYLVNRDSMGKYNATSNQIYQELAGALPGGMWAMPAYFNGIVYFGASGNVLKAFTISNGRLSASATAQTATNFGYPGTTPSVSANGTSNGIVWAVENASPAVLHAYDASTLNELYNSNQAAGGRDQFGAGNKFMTPMIVNGKVFVGTPNGVAEFGLLH